MNPKNVVELKREGKRKIFRKNGRNKGRKDCIKAIWIMELVLIAFTI